MNGNENKKSAQGILWISSVGRINGYTIDARTEIKIFGT